MIALLQRVTEASVSVDGNVVAAIGAGLLVFIGVERGDTEAAARRLTERVLAFRLFADATDKMNRNVVEAGGGLLLVPQFTLAADTDSGNRASFSSAAPPSTGKALFTYLVEQFRLSGQAAETGEFGANMQVALVNDGPVTFRLRVASRV